MGARRPRRRVRRCETSQGAPPSVQQGDGSAGLEHRGNFFSCIRTSGQAQSLNKAPGSSTHRLHRAGHTLPPAADSDFDFPFLPLEHGVHHISFAKEKFHDKSSPA